MIVSDLPLQSVQAGAGTRAMADAIRLVLQRRDFRAGSHTVGYRSCDDSTAQTGDFENRRCAANANAYTHAERLVAVIGPYNSYCASVEIPILNRARGGPLAIISPSNTCSQSPLADNESATATPATLPQSGRRGQHPSSPLRPLVRCEEVCGRVGDPSGDRGNGRDGGDGTRRCPCEASAPALGRFASRGAEHRGRRRLRPSLARSGPGRSTSARRRTSRAMASRSWAVGASSAESSSSRAARRGPASTYFETLIPCESAARAIVGMRGPRTGSSSRARP